MTEESPRAWKDQYMLRLPDGMRERIKAAAAENNRSMNAEIVATLEEKYPAPEVTAEDFMLQFRETVSAVEAMPPGPERDRRKEQLRDFMWSAVREVIEAVKAFPAEDPQDDAAILGLEGRLDDLRPPSSNTTKSVERGKMERHDLIGRMTSSTKPLRSTSNKT